MPLLKNGQIIDDPWVFLDDPTGVDEDTPLFVTLEQWEVVRDTLLKRAGPLGLRLNNDQSPSSLAEELDHFDAVSLPFPKFTDGRAYSHARILRERLRFTGELRAVGQVLRDQLLFMHRCGFDAYELPEGEDGHAWVLALAEITLSYQSAVDERARIADLRRRRTAAA